MATLVYLKAASRSDWDLAMPPTTPDGLRQLHMWNILRGPVGREGVSAADLALFASVEGLIVGEAQAQRYLAALGTRNAVQERSPGRFVLRNLLRKHATPAMLLSVPFLYLPGTTLADRVRYEAVEAPL